MAFRPRHLLAAAAVSGAVIVGGATWASAQDTSSEDDGSTTTTEAEAIPEGQDQRPEDCPERGSGEAPAPAGGGYGTS